MTSDNLQFHLISANKPSLLLSPSSEPLSQFPPPPPPPPVHAVFSRDNPLITTVWFPTLKNVCLLWPLAPAVSTLPAALVTIPAVILSRCFPQTDAAAQFTLSLPFRAISSAPSRPIVAKVLSSSDKNKNIWDEKEQQVEDEEEVEENLPWIQEKALDLVEFTGSVSQAIPGPRVGRSSLPWVLAVPLAYVGITFVIAFVKTVRKFSSPREKRRKLVNKNAMLCKSIDVLFEKGMNEVDQSALQGLVQKTGFDMDESLRKYIRYALNEKPFNPALVSNLIQLRKKSMLDDSQVAGILNEISRRIVEDKGPVVMDTSGYSEKGLKRKLAVRALFGKVYYLSELPEFCSRGSSLTVKEIFGVADEDAEKLRLHTVSEAGDLDSLEKMIHSSDSEELSDESSNAS